MNEQVLDPNAESFMGNENPDQGTEQHHDQPEGATLYFNPDNGNVAAVQNEQLDDVDKEGAESIANEEVAKPNNADVDMQSSSPVK